MPPAPARAAANGQAAPRPQTQPRTTPQAGQPRTTEQQPQAADDRKLPAGSGQIDAPEGEDPEEVLEMFRQLNGTREEGVADAAAQRTVGSPDPQGDGEDAYDPEVPSDDGFAMSFDGGSPPEAPAPQQEVVEEPQPPTEPAAAPEAAPVVTQPVQAQPAQTPTPAEPQAPSTELTFETMASELARSEQLFVNKLAETAYAVSDKDLEALAENPKQVYSNMLAKVHVNAVSSMMRTMAQQLPVVVHAMLRASRANEAAAGRFWQAFPQLDKNNPDHRRTVSLVARNVRALNPNMAESDAVRFTGAQALVMLGLYGQQPGAPTSGSVRPQAAARPQGPPAMPGRQVRQTQPAYSPAAPAAAGGRPQGAPQRGQWDLMASLIELENNGRFDPLS